jgi:predicted phosphate transport protein (TIGR00153 family)
MERAHKVLAVVGAGWTGVTTRLHQEVADCGLASIWIAGSPLQRDTDCGVLRTAFGAEFGGNDHVAIAALLRDRLAGQLLVADDAHELDDASIRVLGAFVAGGGSLLIGQRPVERVELERFISSQDKIADKAEDFAVILTLRNTKMHPAIIDKFFGFLEQIFQVTGTLLGAAVELKNLAEVSFSGAEARHVLDILQGLNEEEWKADRLARSLSRDIYRLEGEVDPITIIFYEKMLLTLGDIANEAENAGDMLRTMIVK